ncbi:MAG: hypothetical protein ACK521_05080 [bacterium]
MSQNSETKILDKEWSSEVKREKSFKQKRKISNEISKSLTDN